MLQPFPYSFWKASGNSKVTPINEPLNVVAQQTGAGEITVNWSNQVAGYKLYIDRFDSSFGDWVKVVDGTDVTVAGDGSFVDTGLVDWATYFHYQYRIWFNKGAFSSAIALSNPVSAKAHYLFDKMSVKTGIGSADFEVGWNWLDKPITTQALLRVYAETFGDGLSPGWEAQTIMSTPTAFSSFDSMTPSSNITTTPNSVGFVGNGIILAGT